MSTVAETTGIVQYTTAHWPALLQLARVMHSECAMSVIPLAEDKLREQCAMANINPAIYLRLWMHEREIVGALYGFIASPYWSHEPIAYDRAWFVVSGRRGGIAAVRLLRDFEQWAKQLGVRWVMPGQTTGVKMEETRQLFEHCGYRMRGCNFVKEL